MLSSLRLFFILLFLVSFSAMSATPSQTQAPNQAPELVLNDIHTPTQISTFPMAIGWWLIAFTVIGLVVFFIRKHLTNKRLNKDKNTALQALQQDENMNFDNALLLLKWVAMQYFNRSEIAKLHGNHFQQFLSSQLSEQNKVKFNALTQSSFNQQYQEKSLQGEEQAELQNFKDGVVLWVNNAVPPKKLSNGKNS